jgi:hydroxymethylglutaryl-CoA reductase
LSEIIFENLTEGSLVGSINSGGKLVNTNQGWVKCSYPNTNGTETPELYKKEYFTAHRQKKGNSEELIHLVKSIRNVSAN